jgi:hypothetical protein
VTTSGEIAPIDQGNGCRATNSDRSRANAGQRSGRGRLSSGGRRRQEPSNTDQEADVTSQRLLTLSGLSLSTGGLLATAGFLLSAWVDPAHTGYQEWHWLPFNFLVIVGGFFMILGLPGFYAAQARQSGLVGLAAFVILFAGIAFAYLVVHSIQTVTMPNTPPEMGLIVAFAAPSLLVGSLLTAVAIWRVGVYARWLAALLVIAIVLGIVSTVAPTPVWGWRHVISSAFTLTMAMLGTNLILVSSRLGGARA